MTTQRTLVLESAASIQRRHEADKQEAKKTPQTEIMSCASCLGAIPFGRMFFVLDTTANVCTGCMAAVGKRHADIWPGCPDSWHDAYDHSGAYTTRPAFDVNTEMEK